MKNISFVDRVNNEAAILSTDSILSTEISLCHIRSGALVDYDSICSKCLSSQELRLIQTGDQELLLGTNCLLIQSQISNCFDIDLDKPRQGTIVSWKGVYSEGDRLFASSHVDTILHQDTSGGVVVRSVRRGVSFIRLENGSTSEVLTFDDTQSRYRSISTPFNCLNGMVSVVAVATSDLANDFYLVNDSGEIIDSIDCGKTWISKLRVADIIVQGTDVYILFDGAQVEGGEYVYPSVVRWDLESRKVETFEIGSASRIASKLLVVGQYIIVGHTKGITVIDEVNGDYMSYSLKDIAGVDAVNQQAVFDLHYLSDTLVALANEGVYLIPGKMIGLVTSIEDSQVNGMTSSIDLESLLRGETLRGSNIVVFNVSGQCEVLPADAEVAISAAKRFMQNNILSFVTTVNGKEVKRYKYLAR